MIFGKTKITAFFNVLILAVLAVAIWFYIQQQIVGERDIEFSFEVRVRAEGGLGDVIVLARSVDGSVGNDTLSIRLRGSKAELDEIFRSTNVATVTLDVKAADFDANPLEPLTKTVKIGAANLRLPPEVEIVSAPTVQVVLARKITKEVSVAIQYSEGAAKKLTGTRTETADVQITGPNFILNNPNWKPVTETITDSDLPKPGTTQKTEVRIKTNANEYFPNLKYPVDLDFKQTSIEVQLAVAEEYAEIELKDLPIRILADNPGWLNLHKIEFATPNPVLTLRIRVPRSKIEDKILTDKNVRVYADFTGAHAKPDTYDDVQLRVEYVGADERLTALPEWVEIISPQKDGFKVSAIVTEIEKTTTPE